MGRDSAKPPGYEFARRRWPGSDVGIIVLLSRLNLLLDNSMKLMETLEVLKHNRPLESPGVEIQMACGFMALHLAVLLAAQIPHEFPDHRETITPGVFGDLVGNLERLSSIQDSI